MATPTRVSQDVIAAEILIKIKLLSVEDVNFEEGGDYVLFQ